MSDLIQRSDAILNRMSIGSRTRLTARQLASFDSLALELHEFHARLGHLLENIDRFRRV